MEISWKHQSDLSALHIAYCLLTWPERCNPRCEALVPAAVQLAEVAKRTAAAKSRFWEVALGLTADTPQNHELAERILIRLMPPIARTPQLISELASALSTLESCFQHTFPRFDQEMRLRQEPLRQQWEAFGPGLLVMIGQFTEPAAIAERAEIVLVEPVTGGWGMAHLATNRCHVEAMLTNADPELTEALRLAWLLSQLEFERPVYSDLINGLRLREIAGLAMLPPTLIAAEELGLARYTPETLQRAIELFRFECQSQSSAAVLAEIATVWWETVQASRPEWRIALTGLDRMLDGD